MFSTDCEETHAYIASYHADVILKHSNAIDKAVEVSSGSFLQPGGLQVLPVQATLASSGLAAAARSSQQ